jgi:hypothetical protein
MCGYRVAFKDLDEVDRGTVCFGDDSMVQIEGRGSVLFLCKNGEHWLFDGVYYIPRLTTNIMSIRQLDETAMTFTSRAG